MAVPYTFATATSSIPLSQLDANFSTGITLGNTTVYLGNTTTSFGNVTLTNATISSVASTFPNSFLANSSVTIGSTNVSLGGTATTVAGLTLTSPTINGGTSTATQNLANVTGTLAVGNGGTGLTTLTAGYIPYGNGTSAFSSSSSLTYNGVLTLGTSTSQNSVFNQVIGSGGANQGLVIVPSATGKGWLGFNNGNNASIPAQFTYDFSTSIMNLFSSGAITFNTNAGSEIARFSTAGYLGIGTSSPSFQLQVQNSGDARIAIVSNSTQAVTQYSVNGGTNYWYNYLNSSGNFIFQSGGTMVATMDSVGNLGLGVTPSAWGTAYGTKVIDISTVASFVGSNTDSIVANNTYYSGAWYYKTTNYASYYDQASGKHIWFNAPSGTAGNAITFTQAMTLDNSGNLLVGTTSTSGASSNTALSVSGIFRSYTASVNATNGTATTITTLTTGINACYLVNINVNGVTNDATNYSAFATIITNGTTARIANSSNGTLCTITLSGLNIQVTQLSGSTQTCNATLTRIA